MLRFENSKILYNNYPSIKKLIKKYWGGLVFPSPGDLPNPGIEPMLPMSPALAVGFLDVSTIIKLVNSKKYPEQCVF